MITKEGRNSPKTNKALDKLGDAFGLFKLIPAQMDPILEMVRDDQQRIRDQEKLIRNLCINKARMPRDEFISSFTKNETNVNWVDSAIAEGRDYSSRLQS